jgi:hypothetical protein
MQDIALEYTVTSSDDDWIDNMTFWSLAERNTVFNIIDAINTAHLMPGQAYFLQIQAAAEDGSTPAAIVLTAHEKSGPHPFNLQHLADCICRLIRPSRYYMADIEDPDREVWSQVFRTEAVSAHEKLRVSTTIAQMAHAIGRTEFGINAAFDELLGWSEDRLTSSPL